MVKEEIFLHSCCGPCSTAVIERLSERYRITVYFYNPNITNEGEYHKRYETEKQFIDEYNSRHPENPVSLIEGDYDPEFWAEEIHGLEDEPENGARCTKCFEVRLRRTAEKARKLGYGLIASTLSVSSHKSTEKVNAAGYMAAEEYGLNFLDESFKKKDGFKRSVELSKEYGLYRQNYCGCIFSQWEGAVVDHPEMERVGRKDGSC